MGLTDGYTDFHEKTPLGFKVPSGLTDMLIEVLGEWQNQQYFEFTYMDNRPDPILLSSDVKFPIQVGVKTLRDYQEEAVIASLDNLTGIIKHSTNSGKTSSALGLIQELLPHTEKDERIAFFTESTAIFNQVYTEFSETLDVPVGRWGAGKKEIKKVTVVMVQTIYAGVKADPEKGLKLTPKQRIQKKMTKEILPIIENTVNPKLVLQNFASTFKVKTKADQDFLDEVNEVIKKSESGAKAKFHVNKYGAEYQKIVKKKAEKVYKKNKEAMDFLESLVGFIVDECLVEDTLITKLDGTQDYIKNFKVGDEIVGGVIEDIKVTEKETVEITHQRGTIGGSLTHPTYVVKANDYKQGNRKPKILPFMAIEKGDYLVHFTNKDTKLASNKNSDEVKIAKFIALMQADGHIDKNPRSSRVKINITDKKSDWVKGIFEDGVKALDNSIEVKSSLDTRGNRTYWVNSKYIREFLENNSCPSGKKSTLINVPRLIQEGSRESIIGYLEVFINCEGDLNIYNKNNPQSQRLSINTTSKSLANGLVNLLNILGITTTTQTVYRKNDKHSTIYRVCLTGNNLVELSNTIELEERLRVTRDYIEEDTLENSEYTLSKVSKIVETGKQTVYDFTTTSHTFIADNTLTANCHHTKSDSFYKTFLHAENAIYRIGLTGSIDQNDPMLVQRLRATFSKVISETRNSQMIERGISAKPTIYFSTIEHVLNDIEEELPNGEVEIIKNEPVDISLNKNYMDSYDKGIVKNNYRNTVIAKIAEINYNKGRGVLIILNRIEHGDSISHMLDTLGIPHAFVQGEMEVEEREKHFTDMKQGKLKVLISTSLMDEGVDISGIDALIMGAGGKSLRQVLQRIGRGLRYKDDGENKLYVYDFTDRVNDFLFSHYKQRREIYEEEGFDIIDL